MKNNFFLWKLIKKLKDDFFKFVFFGNLVYVLCFYHRFSHNWDFWRVVILGDLKRVSRKLYTI